MKPFVLRLFLLGTCCVAGLAACGRDGPPLTPENSIYPLSYPNPKPAGGPLKDAGQEGDFVFVDSFVRPQKASSSSSEVVPSSAPENQEQASEENDGWLDEEDLMGKERKTEEKRESMF